MPIYLTENKRFFDALRRAKFNSHNIASENLSEICRNGEDVIVVGEIGKARSGALDLKARGVAEKRLKYIEADNIDALLLEQINCPRHLHWPDARPLFEAADDDDFEVHDSGFPFLDPNLKWRDSELAVLAGAYGSGKSTLAQLLATRFIAVNGRPHGWTGLLCSWEDLDTEMKRNVRAHARHHKMDPDWLLKAMHYVCRPPSEDRLITWYMDLVRYYVSAFNTKFFVLDPWSEFDHIVPPGQKETDYVRDMMKEFRRLVDELKIIMLVATHVPGKYVGGDGTVEAFRIGHAHGSSQFGNKADRGFCVVRTSRFGGDHMIVRFDKVKIERRMGHKGTVALVYDQNNHTLSPDMDVTGREEVRNMWKG